MPSGCWYSSCCLTRASRIVSLGASWSLLVSKKHHRRGYEASSLLSPHSAVLQRRNFLSRVKKSYSFRADLNFCSFLSLIVKHLTETPPDLPASVSWPLPEQLLLLLPGLWEGTWVTRQERHFSWQSVFRCGGVWAGSSAHAHALCDLTFSPSKAHPCALLFPCRKWNWTLLSTGRRGRYCCLC